MFLLHSHVLNFGDMVIVLGCWGGWRVIGGWHILCLTRKVSHRRVCDQDKLSPTSIAHKEPNEVPVNLTSLGPQWPRAHFSRNCVSIFVRIISFQSPQGPRPHHSTLILAAEPNQRQLLGHAGRGQLPLLAMSQTQHTACTGT